MHFFEKKKAALSPRGDQDKHDGIAHNNLKLANRIFDIMEGPGIITHILKKREKQLYDHPGTLNFKQRVKEATRIHKQNISMAMRLDNVKPYYRTTAQPIRAGSPTKKETPRNKHNVPGLDFPKSLFNQGGEAQSAREPGSKKVSVKHLKQSKSARGEKSESSASASARKNNVLLEYSKIQNGRVLDVAVIKEPFQDRYAIFGIDIDNGKRYELRLTSDDVSSILDGDILVTSLDNVEVWLALLNKVTLKPVEMFSKLASPPTAEADPKKSMAQSDMGESLEPEAPAMERPTTRPGGRGSRGSQTRVNDVNKVPSVDQYEDEIVDDSVQQEELHSVPIVVDEQGGGFVDEDVPLEQEGSTIEEVVEGVGNITVDEPTVAPGTPVQPAPPSQPKGAPTNRPSSRPAGSRPKK
jgi:hypothetical protein